MGGSLRIVGAVFGAAVVLLVVPNGGRAAAPAAGSASATSFLFRLTVGDREAALGSDVSEAALGDEWAASARLVAGSAGEAKVGDAERTASPEDAGGRTPVAAGAPVSIGGLLTLDGIDGSISASVDEGAASSEISVTLGPARLLGGLAVVGGGTSETSTRVTEAGAETTRTIALHGVRLLPLGELLEAGGAGRLDLSCDALERIGTLIGVTASSACESLAAATAGIGDAIEALSNAPAELAAARDDLTAQRDALDAQIDGVQATIDGLEAQKASLQAARDGLEAQRGALDEARDALEAERSDLVSQAAGHTRAGAEADRATVAGLCQGLGVLETLTCQATAMLTSLPDLASDYGVVLPATFPDATAAVLAAIDGVLAVYGQIDGVDDHLDANAVQIDLVDGQLDGNAALIAAVNGQIDAAQSDLAGLEDDLDGILAQLDDVLTALGLIGASPGDAGATCDAARGALGTSSDLVPSLRAAFDPIEAALASACGGLRSAVDAVMETPLLSLDGFRMTLTTTAGDGTAAVSLDGAIGSVQVGALAPVAADLSVASGEVPAVRKAVGDLLAQVSAAVGMDLPVPEFEFLVTDSETGRGDDGSSIARGSVAALRVHVPTAGITVPDVSPLGVLDSVAPSAASVRAAGLETAPDVTVDLGVFDAASRFRAASVSPPGFDAALGPADALASAAPGAGGSVRDVAAPAGAPERGPLPVTGVGLGWSAAGALSLCGAAAVRRFVLR